MVTAMDENDALIRAEAHRDWERARQAAFFEDLLGLFSEKSEGLLSFEEVRKNLRLGQKDYKGIHDIPLRQVRGSVGRYRDFTMTFLPRTETMRQRWERVSSVVIASGLDPIDVYQVGDAYFVLDGNHRVSVARSAGMKTIQANVWEFSTPVGLSAHADLDELLIKTEYADFLASTHLDQLRPEQRIELSTPGRYRELEYQIALYREALEKIDGVSISRDEAVTAWYDMIYTPAVQIIEQSGIMDRFPGRTEADLFAWIWRHHQHLPQRYQGRSLAATVDELMKHSQRSLPHRLFSALAGVFRAGKNRG
jgi:uncharacterized ParB-like nuclease family protein